MRDAYLSRLLVGLFTFYMILFFLCLRSNNNEPTLDEVKLQTTQHNCGLDHIEQLLLQLWPRKQIVYKLRLGLCSYILQELMLYKPTTSQES